MNRLLVMLISSFYWVGSSAQEQFVECLLGRDALLCGYRSLLCKWRYLVARCRYYQALLNSPDKTDPRWWQDWYLAIGLGKHDFSGMEIKQPSYPKYYVPIPDMPSGQVLAILRPIFMIDSFDFELDTVKIEDSIEGQRLVVFGNAQDPSARGVTIGEYLAFVLYLWGCYGTLFNWDTYSVCHQSTVNGLEPSMMLWHGRVDVVNIVLDSDDIDPYFHNGREGGILVVT